MAPKPNGFLMFMKHYKKREEKRGRHFEGGIRGVQEDPQCSREWQVGNIFFSCSQKSIVIYLIFYNLVNLRKIDLIFILNICFDILFVIYIYESLKMSNNFIQNKLKAED